MIGSTVTTFGKIDNAERGTTCCVDLALTKYEAVILSLPSFRPKFFKKSFQQLSTTPLGDQLHCNLHDLITYSPLQLHHYLVKPQHTWDVCYEFVWPMQVKSSYRPQAMKSMFGILVYFHFSTTHQPEGVSGGVFDWMATDHDLQLHRADSVEFLW